MNLLVLILIGFLWLFWLAISFRGDYKKIVFLLVGAFCEATGAYLILREGIKADEQITQGNIFEIPFALLLVSIGLLIYTSLTILKFLNDKNNHK